MKHTEPPEGHRWHLPKGIPAPEGWRHCLEAEIHEGQSWSSKRVRCRRWDTLEKDWTTTEDWGGNSPLIEYIVPDTTPFDIPNTLTDYHIENEDRFVSLPFPLTKREWFAGMAMQGILSNHHVDPTTYGNKAISELSTFFTDALIAALNQKEETK
jgi:hypothetical protein